MAFAERLNGRKLQLKDGSTASLSATVDAKRPRTVSIRLTNEAGEEMAFGSRIVVNGNLDKGSFMTYEAFENKGVARAVYDAFAVAVLPGTALRIESAQKETNIVLTTALQAKEGKSDDELSEALLAAGRATKWAKIIEKDGLWRLVGVRPMDGGYEDDGHRLRPFELRFARI